ncbi:FAD-binding protein [Stappia stellulata]|uniref:FAD-binding oxidoreductase n=1 Tax=Stappia stellulata TaxID=71235 RepID=UPI001CD55B32|nr:FAD-binding protein [Stappia stellulata]MCA1242213.1 FAD-binding protein [Stappia stellulata]
MPSTPPANDPSALAAFLEAARSRIGAGQVAAGDAIGAEWTSATLPWTARPLAVLSPETADAVPALLALAAHHGVAVHPVSRGRSWGLGSRLPPRDAAILDLSGLDRILDVDMARGTARIEPGVTFEALQARLKAEGLAFHLPSFGGPRDASVLANALERGEGAGPLGDRFASLWDLDVALATGERFRTGHARFAQEPLSARHARPAGPLVEGLFSQSGLGVMLSGRIALQPTLAHANMILADIGTKDGLDAALATLTRLIHAGLVAPHAAAIWNGAKRVSSLVGRHHGDAGALATKPDDWALSVVVTAAHPDLLQLSVRIVTSELAKVCRDIQVQSDRDADGRRLETPITGFSDGNNVMSAYWGKAERPEVPGNPDLDGCGFLWVCPALPLEGQAVRALADLLETVAAGTPLYPALGLQAVTARALHGYVSLAWDRSTPGADAAAMTAHDALIRGCHALGFAPYRLGLADADALDEIATADDDWPAVLTRLRAALDPSGTLSPGRLRGLRRD